MRRDGIDVDNRVVPEPKTKEDAPVVAIPRERAAGFVFNKRRGRRRERGAGFVFNNRRGWRRQRRSHVLVIVDDDNLVLHGPSSRSKGRSRDRNPGIFFLLTFACAYCSCPRNRSHRRVALQFFDFDGIEASSLLWPVFFFFLGANAFLPFFCSFEASILSRWMKIALGRVC